MVDDLRQLLALTLALVVVVKLVVVEGAFQASPIASADALGENKGIL